MPAIGNIAISQIRPYKRNARTHSQAQIEKLRASLREFGFVNPVLIDKDNNLIAGHGRIEAARLEGMTEVPFYRVEHLTDVQRRAYTLADNRLAEDAGWDKELLRFELSDLQGINFDIGVLGFEQNDFEEFGAVDLNDEPQKRKQPEDLVHCPKCGFRFSV